MGLQATFLTINHNVTEGIHDSAYSLPPRVLTSAPPAWRSLYQPSVEGCYLCCFQPAHAHNSCQLKKKKYTVWELWTKFYLGQNEDYSLGNSISGLRNCSKDAVRKVSLYVILGKGAYIQSSICFSSKVSTGLVKVIANQKQMSPWLIVVLSQIWGDARIGLINSSPENISPTIWRSVLQFFPEHRVLYF